MSDSPRLPNLEEPCPYCNGRSRFTENSGRRVTCTACDGAGTIPTEFGERVWAFVSRRLPGQRRAGGQDWELGGQDGDGGQS